MTDPTPATEAGRRPARAALIEAMIGLDAWSSDDERSEWIDLILAIEAEARTSLLEATDGLPHTISDLLRKYGGTMKGRGDHDIFDALVRYRAELERVR